MRFICPDQLSAFIQPTRYCDSDNGQLKAFAERLIKESESMSEAALEIFQYVRDSYKFGFSPADQKASDTLKGNLGWCVTKTNLQIALLRAIGIPARYHQVVIQKQSLQGIILKSLYNKMEDRIWFHPWCECFLNERWTSCDLWIDKFTYQAAIRAGIYQESYFPTIDWDGVSDLTLVDHWLLEDVGIHADYDEIIDKVVSSMKIPSFILNVAVKMSNRQTAKLRKSYL